MASRYSRKQFMQTLYAAIAQDNRFDAIEGAERQGLDTILVHPFDGQPLRIAVTHAGDDKQLDLDRLLSRYAKEEGTDRKSALRDLLIDLHHLADKHGLDMDRAITRSEEVFQEECSLADN